MQNQLTLNDLKKGQIAIWKSPAYGKIAILCCADASLEPMASWPHFIILSKSTNGPLQYRGGFWTWGSTRNVSWINDPCKLLEDV